MASLRLALTALLFASAIASLLFPGAAKLLVTLVSLSLGTLLTVAGVRSLVSAKRAEDKIGELEGELSKVINKVLGEES